MNNMTTYHYCAKWPTGPGQELFVDGIVGLSNPVQTMEDYRALKKIVDPENAGKITIVSLTPLAAPNAGSAAVAQDLNEVLNALEKLVQFAEPVMEKQAGFGYMGRFEVAKKILAKHGRGPAVGSTGFEEAAGSPD